MELIKNKFIYSLTENCVLLFFVRNLHNFLVGWNKKQQQRAQTRAMRTTRRARVTPVPPLTADDRKRGSYSRQHENVIKQKVPFFELTQASHERCPANDYCLVGVKTDACM